jgi:hypothetical protein
MRLKGQTEEAFAEDFGTFPNTGEAPKGKGYIELLVDNIVGLDNEYESFGEAFGKSFNEDELGTLKNMAVSAYEGAKEFVTSPIETSKDIATEISDSVSRLGTESLDGRIRRLYGVGYQDATEEQVTKAREAVIGDAITASSLVPAAKGATAVAKAAIPGKVQADVVGQMRSLIDGDKEFRTESKNPAQGLSADVTGSTYKPKMFSSGEVKLTPGGYSLAEFYSPTVETIKNSEFPSKGYKGSELLKLLQDKTPGIRKAEVSAMNLGIDPQKRYNKEEVLGLAEKRSYKVTVEEPEYDFYSTSQRQDIKDPQVAYSTLKINATPNSGEVSPFMPLRGRTHYDDNTIAHTRMSIRETPEGSEYALVEELQSDLLQHGTVKPRGAVSIDEAYEEVKDYVVKDITPKLKPLYEEHKEYFDTVFKTSGEKARLYAKREKGLEVSREELKDREETLEKERELQKSVIDSGKFFEKDFHSLYNYIKDSGDSEGWNLDRRTRAVGESPITETSDVVRLGLQAAMAKADDSGVTSLVIPNVERILAADRARPGSEEFQKYLEPSSGFQRTYTKGVEKFVKQLKEEFGDRIRIETIELPYTKQKHYYQGEEVALPSTALKINFGDLKDVNLRVGRFAEGGMVEDDQMNRLMQEGGMADDGMSREPVTGNEIPPGSLASEVRDDIPAQLSEGEYVVPADVLRYYGVRFFEDLRAQAKQGMMEMEADGRIGGTPVDAQGVPMEGQEEQLTPEEEQMLVEALGSSGMAYGGMVEQPISTPYQDQATMYQMPMGMQEGGVVEEPFDRTKFTLGDNTSSGIETKRYINPTTKEERTVSFLNGAPLGIIPEGFVPWTQELADQPKPGTGTETGVGVTPPKTNRGRSGADRDKQPTTGEGSTGWAEKNYDAITANPFDFGMKALTGASENKLGIVGKTAIGGVFNDAGKITALGNANAALSRLDPNSAEAKALKEGIETLADSLSSPAVSIAYQSGIVGSGKQFTRQLEAYTPAKGTAPTTSTTPKSTATTTTTTTQTSSKDKNTGANRVDPGLSKAVADRATGQAAVDKALAVGKGIQGNRAADKALADKAAAQTAKEKANKEAASRAQGNLTRRAEGGLISRPQKTERNKKGLAS